MIRIVGAVALALATGVALISVGGIVLWASPFLIAGHWLAARNSQGRVQTFWGVLAAVTAAEAAWLLMYVSNQLGEWPITALALGLGILVFWIGRRQLGKTSSVH
jgi:hypothetical protein